MKIAFTSDIHADVSPENERVPEIQMPILAKESPDIFIVCGDVSADQRHFQEALKKYGQLTCPKLAVAGNHDLWVEDQEENSIEKYRYVLYGHSHERKEQIVGGIPAMTHSVGYEWEWAERGMDPGDSVRLFEV